MRVFVLCTGRCGSVTFSVACQHLSSYTVGHETRGTRLGYDRLDYPDQHIEVDNRLSWLLGRLARRYDDSDVLYVHLKRDPEAVAQSFLKRWADPRPRGILGGYAHGVLQRGAEWREAKRIEVCRDYVETVNANIGEFCRGRESIGIDLEDAADQFPAFLDRIGAEGDLHAAVAAFGTIHNAS